MKDLKTTTQTYERIGKALGLSPAVLGRTQTNPTDKQMNLFLTNWELLDWVLKKSSLLWKQPPTPPFFFSPESSEKSFDCTF